VRPEVTERAAPRATWRAIAVPTEHGGWGLTLEPVLLGLLVAFSWAGVVAGLAAFIAFLLRTPLKLVLVDRRRQRFLERTRLASRIAAVELATLAALAATIVVLGGWRWLIPVALALPLVGIELWFDIRSRSRRLVPEIAGSIGIAGVVAVIAVLGDTSYGLAAALWLVLAGRAFMSIPFVRTQIARLHHGTVPLATTTALHFIGVAVAALGAAIEWSVIVGTIAVGALAVVQATWMRRATVPPAKVLGIWQMILGFAVVAATAAGVRTIG
jgi:hypothetical protein